MKISSSCSKTQMLEHLKETVSGDLMFCLESFSRHLGWSFPAKIQSETNIAKKYLTWMWMHSSGSILAPMSGLSHLHSVTVRDSGWITNTSHSAWASIIFPKKADEDCIQCYSPQGVGLVKYVLCSRTHK